MSTVPDVPPMEGLNIAELTAAPFLGIVLNWALMGVLSVQVYVYHINFHDRDRMLLKVLAYGMFVLDIIQTGLSTWDGFHWFVVGWGNLKQLKEPLASSFDSPFFDGIAALVVQTYFCWRIYILSQSKWWSASLFFLTLLQAGAAMATGVICAIINDLTLVQKENLVATVIWLSASSLTDTLIAISTGYLLLRRSESRHKRVDFMIAKIVRLTVETNALTASVAVLSLILYIAFPEKNYFICPPYIFGKLYSNTLLAMFNNRILLSPAADRSQIDVSTHRLHRSLVAPNGTNFIDDRQHQLSQMLVHVHKVTLTDGEPGLELSERTENVVRLNEGGQRHVSGDSFAEDISTLSIINPVKEEV